MRKLRPREKRSPASQPQGQEQTQGPWLLPPRLLPQPHKPLVLWSTAKSLNLRFHGQAWNHIPKPERRTMGPRGPQGSRAFGVGREPRHFTLPWQGSDHAAETLSPQLPPQFLFWTTPEPISELRPSHHATLPFTSPGGSPDTSAQPHGKRSWYRRGGGALGQAGGPTGGVRMKGVFSGAGSHEGSHSVNKSET